ncbi:hypothetical protein LINPERPRIM_LOCUS2160 [Linum perenne]
MGDGFLGISSCTTGCLRPPVSLFHRRWRLCFRRVFFCWMTVSSSSEGAGSGEVKIWADLFKSDSDLALSYIKPILKNGVLQISKDIMDLGLQKMK